MKRLFACLALALIVTALAAYVLSDPSRAAAAEATSSRVRKSEIPPCDAKSLPQHKWDASLTPPQLAGVAPNLADAPEVFSAVPGLVVLITDLDEQGRPSNMTIKCSDVPTVAAEYAIKHFSRIHWKPAVRGGRAVALKSIPVWIRTGSRDICDSVDWPMEDFTETEPPVALYQPSPTNPPGTRG